jgi:hypothetical protein
MKIIHRTWNNGDKLMLQLPMDIRISEWGSNSRSVERGPLVYALKLEERWEKGNEKTEGDYWCVYPMGNWNYGIVQSDILKPANYMEVKKAKPVNDDFVWNMAHAPLEITVNARRIPAWQIVHDVAPTPVTDRNGLYKGAVGDTVETITLIPYGCTRVRIVAFPVVR